MFDILGKLPRKLRMLRIRSIKIVRNADMVTKSTNPSPAYRGYTTEQMNVINESPCVM